jgi:orotate phosphoribosyltransferase
MEFRSFEDLNRAIIKNLERLPADVDLIVGVPRSGMLAATLLALHLHLPMTDVNGLKKGELMSSGERMKGIAGKSLEGFRHVLIVDDSINSGKAMEKVRKRVAGLEGNFKLSFCAIIATPESVSDVDLHFDVCDTPRVFEWNMMNHKNIGRASIELDGVLCREPANGFYEEQISHVDPYLKSAKEIALIATQRLEKFRKQTEEWLRRHEIKYSMLVMRDESVYGDKLILSPEENAEYKKQILKESYRPQFFIEKSSPYASMIASKAGRMAYCVDKRKMFYPKKTLRYYRKAEGRVRDLYRKFMPLSAG